MKKLIAFICFIFIMINCNVYAMTNKNGVEIDDNIYQKLVYYYGDEYLMTITNDNFNLIGIFSQRLKIMIFLPQDYQALN